MCIVLYAQDTVPGYRVVLAANRDEFHARPTEPLHWWSGDTPILAGRDGRAGGTWLGVCRDARFACVLNAPAQAPRRDAPSRGALVPQVLAAADWHAACRRIAAAGADYGGFHLLCGDGERGWYGANTGADAAELGRGCHTVDNTGLNRSDGRSHRADRLFRELPDVSRASLLALLADEHPPIGVGGDTRPLFLRDSRFGTRCSTLLWVGESGRVDVIERRFDAHGGAIGEAHHAWNRRASTVIGS